MGGYTPWKSTGTRSNRANSSARGAAIETDKKAFEELPLSDGTGAYHFNRSVAYFPVPDEYNPSPTTGPGLPWTIVDLEPTLDRPAHSVIAVNPADLGSDAFRDAVSSGDFSKLVEDFYGMFAACFNYNNVAKVSVHTVPNVTYRSAFDLAEFQSTSFKNNYGDGHDDWVTLRSKKSNFYGTTQKRLFSWPGEERSVVALYSPYLPVLGYGVAEFLELNRMHFLAGRRSWTIGYDEDRKLCFIETMAVERFSAQFYQLMTKVLWLYEDIPMVWENLLRGYCAHALVGLNSYTTPVKPPDFTSVSNGVYFYQKPFASLTDLKSDAVFARTVGRHDGVLA